MTVSHEFIITLVKQSKICEEMLTELQVPVEKQFDLDYILEKIHTLRTVYFIHEKNYQEKVPEVPQGEST